MRQAANRVVPFVYLGIVPIAVTLAVLWFAAKRDTVSIDFHNELYPQAQDVMHWRNPFPPPDSDLSSGANAIWPIAAVLAVSPLVILPPAAADWVVAVIELACLAATLLLLGVRDWRVYGAALLWPPVINATQTGNATLPIAVLCAVAWRYRSARVVPGVAIGLGLALKFFIWPLVLWLVWLRRWTAAALATAIGAGSLLLILPFDSIGSYVALLRNLSRTFDEHSYTLYALLLDLGASPSVARVVWLALGFAVLALAWRRQSFALAIGAALLLSPIVWLHFFALLVVPLAIVTRRFHPAWLIPLPMWFGAGSLNGATWQTVLVLACFGGLLAFCARAEKGGATQKLLTRSPLHGTT